MTSPIITPEAITTAQITNLLSLYPKVIRSHYSSKIKDPKKAAEALKRDTWRYDELPANLTKATSKSKPVKASNPMSLEQLSTLVQWKITHGHSRPFLPAMIRKNDAKTVTDIMGKVGDLLQPLSEHASGKGLGVDKALEITLKAFDTVSKLSGVGPATASLVLSVYIPMNVPYFEDEAFAWLCSDWGKEKLKYDGKEYMELFRRVWQFRQGLGMEVTAVEVEKLAFVLGHWDLVDEKGKEAVKVDRGGSLKMSGAAGLGKEIVTADAQEVVKESAKLGRREKQTKKRDAPGSGGHVQEERERGTVTRQSKRRRR
jgi:hypothetical protein